MHHVVNEYQILMGLREVQLYRYPKLPASGRQEVSRLCVRIPLGDHNRASMEMWKPGQVGLDGRENTASDREAFKIKER